MCRYLSVRLRGLGLVFLGAILAVSAVAETLRSSQGDLVFSPVLAGLEIPWAIGFLPDGGFLVTEREGRLLVFRDGKVSNIKGLPQVWAEGQGGLLDVLVPRDFATRGEVVLSFAKPQGAGAVTAVAVGRLDLTTSSLTQTRVIFQARSGSSTGRHFGSRLVEAPDGTLFVSLGDRGQADRAQDLEWQQGAIVRINRDGSIPSDNPFVAIPGAQPEIWSFGHRNPQGMAQAPDGTLWAVEHGARGGDEVNIIHKGANYGWPVIAYGRHYSGARIGEGTHKDGMQQPEYYWDPSMAPSGLMIYSGKLWPQWRGNLFVGSLKFDYIARLSGRPVEEKEQLRTTATLRVRDIREAPDGSIWFLSQGNGAVYRITPAP